MSKIQNWVFNQVHGRKLIYNTCWEDPRCDRELLQINADSKIVMITSAGDNALDYLLDDPYQIHSVDMNYRQNALLELKQSIYLNADHSTLFEYFGTGAFSNAKLIYRKRLRDSLSSSARKYWDKHIDYFKGQGIRKSFYYRGTSGALAFLVRRYLCLRKMIKQNVEQLLSSQTIQEQALYYGQLEQRVFNPIIQKILNNHLTMVMAGVPKAQQALIQETYEAGNVDYIKDCFRNIFTQLDASENYFYQVYFNGQYTNNCCPEYLKKSNFSTLKERQGRIKTYTSTIDQFLENNPDTYTHFVLLDHQDWLAAHDVPALEKEWRVILKNSQPGTRILLRSAAAKVDFFPDFVLDQVHFDETITQQIHKKDRVGTYASVYLGIVK